MLLATLLDRVFILKDNGQEIRLTDPEPKWSVICKSPVRLSLAICLKKLVCIIVGLKLMVVDVSCLDYFVSSHNENSLVQNSSPVYFPKAL